MKRIEDIWYDFINVNTNLARAERVARAIDNGMQAGLNFIAMFILTIITFYLAWHFDFASTYEGLSGLRDTIIPALPQWLAISGAIITALITVAPTLVEIFTSDLAKANIAVIRMFVLGFSLFDVITDIPVTKTWIDRFQSSFDALGPVLGWIAYQVAFFGWLSMATIGFQLSLVIFGYLTIIYGRKAFWGMSTSSPVRKSEPQIKRVEPSKSEPKESKEPKVTIIDAA
jgi:hypothetical protein